MAFTWEVEALRKMIEGIVEEVEIKQAGDELAQEAIDAYNKRPEANQLWDVYKEKWVPKPDAEEWFKDRDLAGPDAIPVWSEDRGHYWVKGIPWDDADDQQFDIDKKKVEEIGESIEKRSPAIDAFMKALSNVPSDEAKRRKLEDEEEALEAIINPDEGLGGLMAELAEEAGYEPDQPWFKGEKPTLSELKAEARLQRDAADEGNRLAREQLEREAAELAAYENYGTLPKSGKIPVDRRRFLNPKGPKEAAELKKFREHFDPRSDLKLDWVNEILQEFQEDKAPEVIRLPHWTTPVPDHLKSEEGKPDITPFLSYLLRQSPYARLPAAGLLGLGLMGYSKPAY